MVGAAWASNTLATRNSQWSRFINFCHDYGLVPLPALPNTVARFLVWQSRTSKYSTVNNYLSAIIVLHKFYGHDCDFRDNFFIKLVLKGIKNVLGDTVKQKQPLTVEQLVQMYNSLDLDSELELILWTVVITSFRSLLRKSNLVPDYSRQADHLLHRGDVEIFPWGVMLHVTSTKTLRHHEYVLDLPIKFVSNPALCAASAIIHHVSTYKGTKDDPLFLLPSQEGVKPVQYGQVLAFLKRKSLDIGLDPENVGCHSLRRSGAAHMHSVGIPLTDIMCIGD